MVKSFQFTRYLYEKEEVMYSLIFSLLNKNEEESLFWASELSFSGFEKELYEILWQIYQDFYVSLNISFEIPLLKKIKSYKNEKNPTDIIWIIQNIVLRPWNLDMFSLIKITNEFEIEQGENLTLLLENRNTLQIANLVLEMWREKRDDFMENQLLNILNFYHTKPFFPKKKIDTFIKDWQKTRDLLSCIQIPFSYQKLILSRILYFQSLEAKLKMGKNIVILKSEEELSKMPNLETVSSLPAYRILKRVRQFGICPKIGLFLLKRFHPENDIKKTYLNDWLYYASLSPVWKERIETYGGSSDSFKNIVFENEDSEEAFYQRYGYEPDEQTEECHHKSIKGIERIRWKDWFQEQYRKPNQNKLFEIPEEYLDEM